MKKINIIIVCIIAIMSIMFLNGCGLFVSKGLEHGFDERFLRQHVKFVPHISDSRSKSFLELYKYVDGDYLHMLYETGLPYENTIEIEFIYLLYDDETYDPAKQFLLEKSYCDYNLQFDYNEYHFIVISRGYRDDLNSVDAKNVDYDYIEEIFPFRARMLCCNDKNRTLIIMDNILNGKGRALVEDVYREDGFVGYLHKCYDFFDFDAETPHISEDVEIKTFQ